MHFEKIRTALEAAGVDNFAMKGCRRVQLKASVEPHEHQIVEAKQLGLIAKRTQLWNAAPVRRRLPDATCISELAKVQHR